MDRLIVAAKFQERLEILTALGHLFVRALTINTPTSLPQALVPVPLHRLRLLQRGYNQSIEVGKCVARAFDLPLLLDHCTRHKHSKPQSQLSGKERRQNVRGAFSLRLPMQYEHIAIIDDVYTSGSTVSELTACLLAAGCKRVDVWTLARTAN